MPEPQKQDQEVVLKMSDLVGVINTAIKDMDLPQVAALKGDIEKVQRHQMFPSGDGELLETCGKSIVDTRAFSKTYVRDHRSPLMDGVMLAKQLRSFGGPWLSLSPVMQKFVTVCSVGADYDKARAKGIDMKEFIEEVRVENEKATGPLTSTDVGPLIPIEFLATVIEFATAQSIILPKLWRIMMNSNTLRIPKLVQAAGSYFGGIHLYHPGEAELKDKTKPSFDYKEFTAKKLIGLILLTEELVADSSINIINYITALFVRAFQWETEHEVLQGLGTGNQMLGIIKDPNINLVPRTTAGTVKFDDLVDLESSLDENYTDLIYVGRRATINAFRKQKDTGGQPVYHDGFTNMFGASIPPQLLGYPAVKTRNVPTLGTKGDLVLGDFSFYIWAIRQQMTIDTSRDRYFEYDETALRFVVRQDGQPGISEAFSILKDATS